MFQTLIGHRAKMAIFGLDKDTVKLISTTQIITSISTAAKELIENALDADAKNIEINLIDNGCTLIEVKDDGCGISKVDAPYVALPSYTSKISNFSDLDSLESYGFRGESLYALSSISDLIIVSKTEQDEAAVCYSIDRYGCIVKSEPCHRPIGTTVQVKQLFKQMPVRRQIITNSKKASQDIKILESLIKSYGMCKFFVRISYKVDKNIIFSKPSAATFEEAVIYILGKKVTRNTSWINITDTDIKMKIMVPSKETQNVIEVFQSGAQYIFANNRPIKNKELEKVVTKIIFEAMGQEFSSRKKPIFVLYILVNAANIDVNLEPNKTSVLFKEQNMVINTLEKYLRNFYGIQRKEQEGNNSDTLYNDYQDRTKKTDISDIDNEEPVYKKRKLQVDKNVDKLLKKNVNSVETNNSEHKEQLEISTNGQNCQNGNVERCEKMLNEFHIQLPSLNLSDSDSSDLQNFTLVYEDDRISRTLADEKVNNEDTPPFELTPQSQALDQLPTVDLGEDFAWNDCSDINTNEKENKVQNSNPEISRKESKLNTKKSVTLKEWSKGHVSGLKGGTNVEPYAEPHRSSNSDTRRNVCEGFFKFSKHIRSEVIQHNSTTTAPQIAHVITDLWKKLSPEERGYYRDLARDEKIEHYTEKREAVEKHTIDINKNTNRLLKAFEKMKTINFEKKENLVMRTTVPWDINLKKVSECILNNSSNKNTNLVVGLLRSNLWIVYKSAHIWVLNASDLKTKLHISDTNTDEDDVKNIEQFLEQWFSTKDDLSLLYPIHSVTRTKNNC